MSIAVLNQVYDETRRLAIAGSDLAKDDFRLKKLVPPLEKAGGKAPVFAKVAEAIEKVVDPSTKDTSEALLQLSTLVTAVLYTQGETGASGKLTDIETQEFDLPTSDASARVLKPLIEALTTTGSGRLEIIRDAHQRGAFKDLRLVKPAVAAIDDVYGEIGDFVADQVLPMYGKAIYADLRDTLDLKGRGGHVRRLRVMHRLDPKATQEFVEQALESGSKEVKLAALECLKGSKDHISYLLEQVQAKSKDIRRVALDGIAESKDKEVVETLIAALKGSDLELAVGPASINRSPQLLKFLLEEGQRQFEDLFATKDKAKLKTKLGRFHSFLYAFQSRSDKKSDAFLISCLKRREKLEKLKGGDDVAYRVAMLVVDNDSKVGQKLLVETHESLSPPLLNLAMQAALRTCKPEAVFELFSPYFLAKPTKKRGNDPVRDKREVVQNVLHYAAEYRNYYGYYGYYDWGYQREKWLEKVKLDPRWLDAAIEQDELETVQALARPKHKGAIAYLSQTMDAGLKKKGSDLDYGLTNVLDTMVQIKHPDVVDYYVAALEKMGRSKRYYYGYWLLRLVPELPISALAKIEAIVPKLNERIVDELVPCLEQLKAKAK